MKKLVKSTVLASMIGAGLLSGLLFSGCNITPEQGKVIAQQAGLYSAVIWVSIDNPTTNQLSEVKNILSAINSNASKIVIGKTYMEVVYPEVAKVIDTKVNVNDRPLCKAAAMTLLNGLDTLFALHSEWKADSTLAIQIVNAYVGGAQAGLGMDEKSEIMKQARATASTRTKMFVEAKDIK